MNSNIATLSLRVFLSISWKRFDLKNFILIIRLEIYTPTMFGLGTYMMSLSVNDLILNLGIRLGKNNLMLKVRSAEKMFDECYLG